MKERAVQLRLTIFIALIAGIFLALQSEAQVHVRGYTRKDGTYVSPHYRSSPNSSKLDNWSTKGNVNPYTGAVGTKDIGASAFVAPAISSALPAPAATPTTTSASMGELFNEAYEKCGAAWDDAVVMYDSDENELGASYPTEAKCDVWPSE